LEAIHPKYKTFWHRLGASIIDALVVAFMVLIFYFLVARALKPAASFISIKIFTFIASIAYSVLLTSNKGGTIGKLAVGIMVVDGNDEKSFISIYRAIKRDAPLLIADILGIIYLISIDDAYLHSKDNSILRIINSLYSLWFIAELITMVWNHRRRAIHDILANSVVVIKKLNTAIVPQ